MRPTPCRRGVESHRSVKNSVCRRVVMGFDFPDRFGNGEMGFDAGEGGLPHGFAGAGIFEEWGEGLGQGF